MNCQHQPLDQQALHAMTRRHFFGRTAWGIGGIALASLLNGNVFAAQKETPAPNPLAPRAPHFKPRAKRVIYMFMEGAPTQLDLFDYKPKLVEMNLQPCPEELIKGERFAFIKGRPKILGTPHKFSRHGKCGMELSALLPHLGGVADDITLIRSMVTDAFNHAPAQIFLNSGSTQIGRPSMGSWLTYGLGTLNQNLPGFVVISPAQPAQGAPLWVIWATAFCVNLRFIIFSAGWRPYFAPLSRRVGLLEQRIFADGLPGRAIPVARRSGFIFVEPGGHDGEGPPAFTRRVARLERDGDEHDRRSRDRHAHQFV